MSSFYVDIVGVTGSIPVAPTIFKRWFVRLVFLRFSIRSQFLNHDRNLVLSSAAPASRKGAAANPRKIARKGLACDRSGFERRAARRARFLALDFFGRGFSRTWQGVRWRWRTPARVSDNRRREPEWRGTEDLSRGRRWRRILAEPGAAYARAITLFDGNNEDELVNARAQWKEVKERGFSAAYWQQGETGRWEKKA